MDNEVYECVKSLLSAMDDQGGVESFAQAMSFHYPEQGRFLLVAVGALTVDSPPTVEEIVPDQDTTVDSIGDVPVVDDTEEGV